MRPEYSTKALQYIRGLYAEEDNLLKDIVIKLRSMDRQIQIGPEEGKFLQVLIALSGAKQIVEIGTLGAYSTIWMARALPEGGMVHSIEKEQVNYEMAREHVAQAGLSDKITLHCGGAEEVLTALSAKSPFDMVFIDADKIGYMDYLGWAEANIRKNGLIVADNTLLFDSVYEDSPTEGIRQLAWDVMREFNRRLADNNRYRGILLPTKEGLSVAIKQF